MTMLSRTEVDRGRPRNSHPISFLVYAAVGGIAVVIVGGYLGSHDNTSNASQALGNLAILSAGLFATVMCLRRAQQRVRAARAWALMGLATAIWTGGQILYTYYGLSRDNVYPFPSPADAAYLGYAVPAIAALFSFPTPRERLISRLRTVLDALVISAGVFVINEVTVLRSVLRGSDLQTLAGRTSLAYPLVDVTVASLVLSLGMRQSPGRRLTWLYLGGGLVTLAVTDSIYVRLLADGATSITGTPLTAGWMLAFLLIGLAALTTTNSGPERPTRTGALALQLIPYLPALGALVALSNVAATQDALPLASGAALLALLTIRQLLIVSENVVLTSDLEARVAARTAELGTLGSIVTSSHDAIVGISLDNVIIAWNPAAEELYGHRAAAVLGRPPDFLQPEAAAEGRRLRALAREGSDLGGYEIQWDRPDGTSVPVALTVSPILAGERVTGISVFGQDITERQRAAAALEEAREAALESARLKSEFLATMSHEIRTPMNGVIGLTSLLLETDLDEVQRQYAEGVRGAGEALLHVINDILDFSKLEAGKVVLDPGDFDPRRLVEDIGALLAPAAFAKRLELVAYCLPGVPRLLHGDAGRLRQIVLNLASNAVKFTSRGEVAIKVRAQESGVDRVRLRFEVTDTGTGIAEADQVRLFESFSQADASTTRRFGGTGLGLAISRRLVEVMDGEIGLESDLGVGSTFWFEVSLPVGHQRENGQEPIRHDLLCGLRVLVVDDNATNRAILESQLASWQLQPELADGADSALRRLRDAATHGQPYDLVVLDMCMPGVDGLQLARTISADPVLSGLSMIMLTSSLQLDPGTLRDAGIDQWLAKPIRSSELYDRLMRLMAPTDRADRPRSSHVANGQAIGSSGETILVVEDNALNQLVAEGLLERLGYTAHTVGNGVEALDAFETGGYAAILMDCHMPVMDGFTATQEIRRRQLDGQRIPIIAMTAGALSEDRERCLAAGMDDYVSKPVDLDALSSTLSRWIKTAPEAHVAGDAPEWPTKLAPAPSEGPAIDKSRWRDLAELRGPDGASLLPMVARSFLDGRGVRLGTIRRAAEAHDARALEGAAHELNGAAANLGAIRTSNLCREVEILARRSAESVTSGLLDEIESELERVAEALQSEFGSAPHSG